MYRFIISRKTLLLLAAIWLASGLLLFAAGWLLGRHEASPTIDGESLAEVLDAATATRSGASRTPQKATSQRRSSTPWQRPSTATSGSPSASSPSASAADAGAGPPGGRSGSAGPGGPLPYRWAQPPAVPALR